MWVACSYRVLGYFAMQKQLTKTCAIMKIKLALSSVCWCSNPGYSMQMVRFVKMFTSFPHLKSNNNAYICIVSKEQKLHM